MDESTRAKLLKQLTKNCLPGCPGGKIVEINDGGLTIWCGRCGEVIFDQSNLSHGPLKDISLSLTLADDPHS